MIKKYKRQKLYQFLFGLIWLTIAVVFVDLNIVRVGMVILILSTGIFLNSKLLNDIQLDDKHLSLQTYSIINKTEELKIQIEDFRSIEFEPETIFNNTNLIINYQGTNGIITKKFQYNAEPWNSLNSKLAQLKIMNK